MTEAAVSIAFIHDHRTCAVCISYEVTETSSVMFRTGYPVERMSERGFINPLP